MRLTTYHHLRKLGAGKAKEAAGRNGRGVISVQHRGGGVAHLVRSSGGQQAGTLAIVSAIEHAPRRSGNLSWVWSTSVKNDSDSIQEDHSFSLKGRSWFSFRGLIAGSKNGSAIYSRRTGRSDVSLWVSGRSAQKSWLSSEKPSENLGDQNPLHAYAVGDMVSEVELSPGNSATSARAAGAFCSILRKARHSEKTGSFVVVRMPSGEVRLINNLARASVGVPASKQALLASGPHGAPMGAFLRQVGDGTDQRSNVAILKEIQEVILDSERATSSKRNFFSSMSPKVFKASYTSTSVLSSPRARRQFEKTQSAGYSRRIGVRPTVRGAAKNPVDHPHGGDTPVGRPSVTPAARPALGVPSRKTKGFNQWHTLVSKV